MIPQARLTKSSREQPIWVILNVGIMAIYLHRFNTGLVKNKFAAVAVENWTLILLRPYIMSLKYYSYNNEGNSRFEDYDTWKGLYRNLDRICGSQVRKGSELRA